MPFITFEGIDGSGKSSLMQRLATHLKGLSLPLEMTREPGGSNLGPELREILLRTQGTPPVPEAELLIYEADRAQHVATKIKPLLAKNYWVLSDRFYDSSLAFQGAGRRLKIEDVKWLNQFATGGLEPDLTVLLDCPVNVSSERRKRREQLRQQEADRFEKEDFAFHERIRQSFLEIARQESHRFLVLDSTQDLNTLTQELLTELKKRNLL